MGKFAEWRRLRSPQPAGRGPSRCGGRGSPAPEGPSAPRPPGRAGTRRGARLASAGPRSLLRSAPEAAGGIPRASRSYGVGARASAAPGSGPSGVRASGEAAAALVCSGLCVRARRREPECVCVCLGVRVRARGSPVRAGGRGGRGPGYAEARPSSFSPSLPPQPPRRAASRRVPSQLARRPWQLPLQPEIGAGRTRREPGRGSRCRRGGAEAGGGLGGAERRWGRSHPQVSAGDGSMQEAARVLPDRLPESACSRAGRGVEGPAPGAGGGEGIQPEKQAGGLGETRDSAESGEHKERGPWAPGALRHTRFPQGQPPGAAVCHRPGASPQLVVGSRGLPEAPESAASRRAQHLPTRVVSPPPPPVERRGRHEPPREGAGPRGRTPRPPSLSPPRCFSKKHSLGSRGWAEAAPGTQPCPALLLPVPRLASS